MTLKEFFTHILWLIVSLATGIVLSHAALWIVEDFITTSLEGAFYTIICVAFGFGLSLKIFRKELSPL